MIGIYKITSPSGKIYIGQSWNIEKRFKSYKYKNKQSFLMRSFDKYGLENHNFEILEELSKDITQEILDLKEIYYMKSYKDNGFILLNIREGGSRGKLAPETILKIKNSLKGRISNNKDKKIKDITDRFNKNLEEIEKLKYTITKALYNKLMNALFKSDILNKDTLTEIEKIEKILKEQQELSSKYDKEQTAAITKVVETITHLKTLCKNIFFKNNKHQNHTLNTKKSIDTFVGLIYSQSKIFNSKELDQILKFKINKKLNTEINKYKTIKKSLGGTLE